MFEHRTVFSLEDVLHAKEEYKKLLEMAKVKGEYLKGISMKEPMGKLLGDMQRANMTEIIHLYRALEAADITIEKYLEAQDGGSA